MARDLARLKLSETLAVLSVRLTACAVKARADGREDTARRIENAAYEVAGAALEADAEPAHG